jgi:hypothetical protein
MVERKDQVTQATNAASTRPVDLVGDSPELIAFALLRSLAQLEQESRDSFDRVWLLDAYAECLDAVNGKRKPKVESKPSAASKQKRG